MFLGGETNGNGEPDGAPDDTTIITHVELKKYKDLETKYNVLEAEYRSRMCEITDLKKKSGQGFPDHSLLKDDDNMTSFYTGLPSYDVLMSVLSLVDKAAPDSINAKLSHYQCFLLTLMKLRLNLPYGFDSVSMKVQHLEFLLIGYNY